MPEFKLEKRPADLSDDPELQAKIDQIRTPEQAADAILGRKAWEGVSLSEQARRRVASKGGGWAKILSNSDEVREFNLSPQEARRTLEDLAATINENGDRSWAGRVATVTGANVIDSCSHQLGEKLTGEILFGPKYPAEWAQQAEMSTPFESHHREMLKPGADSHYVDTVFRNPHVSPDLIGEAVREGLKSENIPIVKKVIDSGMVDKDSPLRRALMDEATLSNPGTMSKTIAFALLSRLKAPTANMPAEDIDKLVKAHPNLLSEVSHKAIILHHPDLLSPNKVHVSFGTNKLRQVRDLLLENGKIEAPPKDLPPGDWKAGRTPEGKISAQKLQDAIDAAPRTTYGWSESKWDGGQQHTDENSNVLQLNFTSDHIKKLKEAGVYDTFSRLYQQGHNPSHAAGFGGLGWVRWTGGKDGVHIDEVQSDFGKHLRLAGKDDPEVVNKISDILFNGKHPSEVLQEGFHEWARQPKEVVSCFNCGSEDVIDSSYADHGKLCQKCHAQPSPSSIAANTKMTDSFVGTPVHIWTPESKAPLAQQKPDEPLPVHMVEGYSRIPRKMGMAPGEYGELPTQSNEELSGKAVDRHFHGGSGHPVVYRNHYGTYHCPECDEDFDASDVSHEKMPGPAAKTWKDKIRKFEEADATPLVKIEPVLAEHLKNLRAAAPESAKHVSKVLFADSMVPGVGNKLAFEDFKSRPRQGVHVLIDGNDFGQINKIHGFSAGDTAIKAMGGALSNASRMFKGKMFRPGGDEFAAFFEKPEHAYAFAREVRKQLEALPPINGTHHHSVSIGFGVSPAHAEQALIQAKEAKKAANYAPGHAMTHAYSLLPGAAGNVEVRPPADIPAGFTKPQAESPVQGPSLADPFKKSLPDLTELKLRKFELELQKMAVIHDSDKPIPVYRVQDHEGKGPYNSSVGQRVIYTTPSGHGANIDPEDFEARAAAVQSACPHPITDFEPAELDELDTGGPKFAFLAPEHAENWFGPERVSKLRDAGFAIHKVLARKVWRSKSGKQVMYLPHKEK